MRDLTKLQEARLAPAVAELTLSFLYTSLGGGEAAFRIDSYGAGGRVYEGTILSEPMAAPWLSARFKELEAGLTECLIQNSLKRYIRPAEIERLKIRAARSLLLYFTSRFRYIMEDALDRKLLAKVVKEKSFLVEMGEYMDWLKPVFALRPEIDLFNRDKREPLRFRRYAAVTYREKVFRDWVMNQSRFTDCTFAEGEIDGCRMNDCVFDGCSFETMTIKNTEMAGCLFINCDFGQVRFENVGFNGDSVKRLEEYFEPAEFYRCGITSTIFDGCDLSGCVAKECDIEGLTVAASSLEGSGFEHDDRIIREAG